MDSSPAIPFPLLSLLGGVTCLGKTVIFSWSDLYWLISEKSSAVRILGNRFSVPMYIIIALR